MDTIDWIFAMMIVAFVGGMFGWFMEDVHLPDDELGQIICDEQYGSDQTVYNGFDKELEIVECLESEVVNTLPFDGASTQLIKNEG